MSDTYADQWRAAAVVLREHAKVFDGLAEKAPSRSLSDGSLVLLLQEVDGLLGLALHRGEAITDRWKAEATEAVRRIRKEITGRSSGRE